MEIAIWAGLVALAILGVIAGLLILGLIWQALGEAFGKGSPPGRMVDIGGGRKLHLRELGDAPGPTIVLEMGAMEPAPYWWNIQDEIAKFARVVTYDRSGFGWSPPLRRSLSMEDRAADLHTLLTRANIPGPFVLVGHSYGGPLIRLFTRRYPDAAAGLVLVDTPDEASVFRDSYQAFARKQMKPMVRAAGLATRFGVMRAMSLLWPNSPMEPQVGKAAKRALAATRSPNMFRAALGEFDSLLTAPASMRALNGFGGPLGDCPVSVITHGIKFPAPWDVLEIGWDEGQQRLAALSTNSELIVAEKSNHLIQHDEPELVIAAIRRVWLAARDRTRLAA